MKKEVGLWIDHREVFLVTLKEKGGCEKSCVNGLS
jgi:hypothetical protein